MKRRISLALMIPSVLLLILNMPTAAQIMLRGIGSFLSSAQAVATLVVTNAKTLTVTNSLTLSGTDSTTMTFPSTSATIARTDAANTFSGDQKFAATTGTMTTDTDGATITFNLATSNLHQVTLGGNRTLALSNDAAGKAFTICLAQDGTGSRTVTWFTTIKWAGGSAPTLTTTINKTDCFTFMETSSGNYLGTIAGQNF